MPLISDSIGRVLGKRYRLVSALGAGASAHVFLAEDVTLQRRVAVKVLQPALVSDEAFLKRFRAEARAVAQLNHPNVLRVFDWGEDTDGPYLVLEYLGGGSLRDILDRGFQLSPAQAAAIGAEAAHGLAYAHARGLVHRDVKPANVIFDDEGRVRIADFGVARALAEAAWTEPAGAMVGTARYASPEQAEGRRVDGRSDVYSLALVLYESLTGEVPFVADTTLATLMARVGATLPRHRALGPLDDILARAAAPNPDTRLTSAGLAARLEAIGAGLPPPAPIPIRVEDPVPDPLGDRAGGRDRTIVVSNPSRLAAADTMALRVPATDGRRTAVPAADVFDHEALTSGDGAAHGPPPVVARRRRRRWPWVVGIAAGVIVAVVLAATASQVFTPSHRVPVLKGRSVAGARSALGRDQFTLVQGSSQYSISESTGRIVSQQPAAGTSLKQGSNVTVITSKGPPPVSVPSLAGLDCTAVSRVLAAAHLAAACPQLQAYDSNIPSGQVINWSFHNKIDPTVVPYGSTILVATSKGPQPVNVPSVASDTTYAQAQATLQAAGLQATEAQGPNSTVPSGQVINTSPLAGTPVPPGSTVTVNVSTGPPMVNVPDVTGQSVSQATMALQNAGLSIGQVYGPQGGMVFTTSPLAGQQVQQGSSVNLYTQ
jgi:eukaryotic-like serine/threonine-protein kinase